MQQLWKVCWENRHKDTYWRLYVDGLPRYSSAPGCPCGRGGTGRDHVCWSCCQVAQGLVSHVGEQLPGVATFSRLATPPVSLEMHADVWRVVHVPGGACVVTVRWSAHKATCQSLRLHLAQARRALYARGGSVAALERQAKLAAAYWAVCTQEAGLSVAAPHGLGPEQLSEADQVGVIVSFGVKYATQRFWEFLRNFVQLQALPGQRPQEGLGESRLHYNPRHFFLWVAVNDDGDDDDAC